MNVKELKELLNQFDDNLEILYARHSDFEEMNALQWNVTNAVDMQSTWFMRSHPTMSQENKNNEKQYLIFE